MNDIGRSQCNSEACIFHQCAALPDPQLFTQKHAVFLASAIFPATKFSFLHVWSTLRQMLMESCSLFQVTGGDQGFLKLMSNRELLE